MGSPEPPRPVTVRARRNRRTLSPPRAALLLLGLVIAAVLVRVYGPAPGPAIYLRGQLPTQRALPGTPALDNIVYELVNEGDQSIRLTNLELETVSGEALAPVSSGPNLPGPGAELLPGERWTGYFRVKAPRTPRGEYRVCARFEERRQRCAHATPWIVFGPNAYRYGDRFPVPETAHGASAAVWADGAFLLARGSTLLLLREDGSQQAVADLGAPILAVHRAPFGLYLALGGARAELVRLDPASFERTLRRVLTGPWDSSGAGDGQVRVWLGDDGQRLWFLAAAPASSRAAVPAYLAPDLTGLTTPAYGEGLLGPDQSFVLRRGSGALWVIEQGSGPTRVHRLLQSTHTTYEGQTWEAIACARDLLPREGFAFAPDCQGNLNQLAFTSDRVRRRDRIAQLPGAANVDDQWSTVTLTETPDGRLLAAIETESLRDYGGDGSRRLVIARVAWPDQPTIAFDLEGLRLRGMAAGENTVLLLVRDEAGRDLLLAPPLEDQR